MTLEAGLPRRHDEHVSVPTWRLRQLQLIEEAALQSIEVIEDAPPPLPALVAGIRDLLADALESHQ